MSRRNQRGSRGFARTDRLGSSLREIIGEELRRIDDDYVAYVTVTDVEVEQSRNKVASRVVLRSERPMGRLSSLGSNWVYRQEHQTVEDDLKILESLSAKSIRELLEAYPLGQMTTVGIGPLEAPAASA